jgi:hypothetical protein
MLRPGALLEIYIILYMIAARKIKVYIIIFVTGEDNIARFDSRRYNYIV